MIWPHIPVPTRWGVDQPVSCSLLAATVTIVAINRKAREDVAGLWLEWPGAASWRQIGLWPAGRRIPKLLQSISTRSTPHIVAGTHLSQARKQRTAHPPCMRAQVASLENDSLVFLELGSGVP